MSKDLTQQKIWSDIATAYEKAVVRTSFYNELMQKLIINLKGKKRILDLGCGVGYLINELMKEDSQRQIVGVDANQYMLDIAKDVVVEKRFAKNVTLIQADAASYQNSEPFDAVVSSNLLFNLKDPYKFLDNAYENLKNGGTLVLTSAKRNPDLKKMITKMREEFQADGRIDELRKYVEVAESVNSNFIGEMKLFDKHEIADVLTNFIGFDKIASNTDSYLDQNFVIAARKPFEESEIIYKIADKNEIEESFKLRYHILHDRYGFIAENETRREKLMHDDHATHFVAVDSATNKVVGCLFYLEYIDGIGFYAEEGLEIERYRLTNEKLATPGRWYVLPAYRTRGIGKKLFELFFKTCERQKVTATMFNINPENETFFKKLGAQKIGNVNNNYCEFKIPASALPIHIDLKNGMPDVFKNVTNHKTMTKNTQK